KIELRPHQFGHLDSGGCVGLVVEQLHAHNVEARVDIVDFAGDAGRKVGQEVEAGTADIVDIDVAAHGGVRLLVVQHVAKARDAGGGQRLDGAGGDGVDPDAGLAEIHREIAHGSLERGLGNAHDVVVR